MGRNRDNYIPPLKYNWLTPLYDPFVRWTMREAAFKRRLVVEARIESSHRVLDLGCGTATLTLMIKQAHPQTEVVGLDGDLRALGIAKGKAAASGLEVTLERGMSFDLPYADRSFDRVVSSLLFHHLNRENKRRTAEEAFRVLRPGGEFLVADFGRPHNAFMQAVSIIMRRLEEASDNVAGLLPAVFREAGFDQVVEPARFATVFGTLVLYKAQKPR